MPPIRQLIAKLRALCLPHTKRLALWIVFSTGIAFAAKLTSHLPTESSEVQTEEDKQEVEKRAWDTAAGDWWKPEIDIQRLSEIYGYDRSFQFIALEAFTAALQPLPPVQSFSAQLQPAPLLPEFDLLTVAAPKRDGLLVSGRSNDSPENNLFVGGGLSSIRVRTDSAAAVDTTKGCGSTGASLNAAAVPEPTSAALLGLIFAGLAGTRWRQRQAA